MSWLFALYLLYYVFLFIIWKKKHGDRTFLPTHSISSSVTFSLGKRGLENVELE